MPTEPNGRKPRQSRGNIVAVDQRDLSRRERKKLATRNALIQTSKRLFANQGFDKTTLEQICDEVDIHVATFFKYFSSKDELVFARQLDTLQRLRQGFAQKPSDLSVLDFWWAFVDALDPVERYEETVRLLELDDMPSLRGRYGVIVLEYQKVLVNAFAEEAGTNPETDVYAHLKASALMALHINVGRQQVISAGTDISARTRLAQRMMELFPEREDVQAELDGLTSAGERKKLRKR